jgi:hypothetical protein
MIHQVDDGMGEPSSCRAAGRQAAGSSTISLVTSNISARRALEITTLSTCCYLAHQSPRQLRSLRSRMSNSWTTERIEQQQPFTGYASDVTNVSASTSQLDLSDTSRPSLTLARNRTSQSGLKRGRSGLRTGSTEEDLVAEQQAEDITLGFRDSDIRQLNMTSQMTNPDHMQTAKPSLTAGFGKAHKVLYDDTTGSISSALQPNSSDTPASQRTSDSESLTRQPFRSEPLSTGEASDHTSPGHPGITRIWNWISSTGRLSASNDEYRLLESGASKVDGDVKTKHANVARRKRTKRSRDVKGRLVEAEPGGMGQKRMWRRLGVAIMTRPYRSLVSPSWTVPTPGLVLRR